MNSEPEKMKVDEVAATAPELEQSAGAKNPAAEDIKDFANKEFDKEIALTLDKEGLTYICDYCGEINALSAPRCTRCGKRRPRTEYIKAMKSVRTADAIKEEYALEKAMADEEYALAEKTLAEQKNQLMADRREARNLEVVRLVEERVSDEMVSLKAQEQIRIDQERDIAQKMAAREAVLRIISAEKYADDVVEQAKRDHDKIVEAERAKAIDIAAEQLVVQRAGIEKAAMEKIADAEKNANERIAQDRDTTAKMTARSAVLKIIEAEKTLEQDKAAAKEAYNAAALKRVKEERELAQKEANARLVAQLEGIERAADERIKAEREIVKKLLDERNGNAPQASAPMAAVGGMPMQGNQYVQPMVIVPYLNSQQPVLQYKPNQIYKFIPNTYYQQQVAQENAETFINGPVAKEEDIKALKERKLAQKEAVESDIKNLEETEKAMPLGQQIVKKNRLRTRISALLTILAVAGAAVLIYLLMFVPKAWFVADNQNVSILTAFVVLLRDGINSIFGTNLDFLGTNGFVDYIRGVDKSAGILIPLGVVLSAICLVILLVRSIVRLISGNAKRKGILLPIFGLIFSLVAVLGLYLIDGSGFAKNLTDTTYSLIIFAALNLCNLVFAFVTGKNTK